jgi:hypothetical protein
MTVCIIELEGRGIIDGDIGLFCSFAREGGRMDCESVEVPARLGVRCGKREVDLLRGFTDASGDGIPGRAGNLLEVDF